MENSTAESSLVPELFTLVTAHVECSDISEKNSIVYSVLGILSYIYSPAQWPYIPEDSMAYHSAGNVT
jgi:hypothetical protein